MLLLRSNLFKVSLFTPSREVPIFLKSFFMTSCYSSRGQPTFRLALAGWLKRIIFSNLSPFIRRTCPSHLNLFLIIDLESEIEPHFFGAYCLKYGQSAGYLKPSVGNFSGKDLANLHPLFGAPMLRIIFITVASNILIVV